MAARLADFLSAAAARGFAWGQYDCMLFAADWACELTGRDPAEGWRGTYGSETAAQAILDGAGGMHAIMASALAPQGWHEIDVSDTQEGDIVLARPLFHGDIAGIVTYGGLIALLTRRGIVVTSIHIEAAWRHG